MTRMIWCIILVNKKTDEHKYTDTKTERRRQIKHKLGLKIYSENDFR